MKQVRVAVVDDSAFIRKALTRMLSSEAGVRVVGVAESGEELLDNLARWRPDVITLDLTMPGMGGLQTLDRVMAARPTPIIILSTHAGEDAPLTIEALHRGAVDFIDKQRYSLMDFGALRAVLVEKIRQVVSPHRSREVFTSPPAPQPVTAPSTNAVPPEPTRRDQLYRLVVMGASTGGPPTIERILTALGAEVEAPVVVAQHMPPRFTQAFAERLNAHLPLQVREASDGEALVGATAYIAPGGSNLRVVSSGDGRLVASLGGDEHGYHQPSVDVLFTSAAESVGRQTIAVLLTGMGRDGAEGMLRLRRRGARTIAQDRDSCIVYGMPQAAVQNGAVEESLPADRIGPRVRTLLGLDPEP